MDFIFPRMITALCNEPKVKSTSKGKITPSQINDIRGLEKTVSQHHDCMRRMWGAYLDRDALSDYLDSDEDEESLDLAAITVPLPQPPKLDDLDHVYYAPRSKKALVDIPRYQTKYMSFSNRKLEVLAWRLALEKLFDMCHWLVEPGAPLHYFAPDSDDE
ncbi:hypothetical protein ACH5RR_006837 [Cinchona calisaya]|uniref:Uncharacterized protein n=1 Tax=Cinchona calisaya TaxID=153742 RepID=A0ABD3AQG1_9GENT